MHLRVLVPSLMATVSQRNIYLKTYGTVTLLNLTTRFEYLKDSIIAMNVPRVCADHLALRDDDLMLYTLSLLTNLTKCSHHRLELARFGIVDSLLILLPGVPPAPSKHRILAELAGVLGQLCNDDELWEKMCDPKFATVSRLLEVLMAAPNGTRLRSKVFFALRQFSFRPKPAAALYREVIGDCLPAIVEELRGMVEQGHLGDDSAGGDPLDCAVSAVILLSTLSISSQNLQTLRNLQFEQVLRKLMISELSKLDSCRDRLEQLYQRMSGVGQAAAA
eukprot:TRINITY_DN95690_c0_g1_i1.p2 TRINITY_DN95690_c0_g1~~TRINITY_DN95690_c0_g1_i1.p2  ORF type:complete len:277 (+),score=44.55 TRINITY_DN95690_c0_g1_i1:933-1763(+)